MKNTKRCSCYLATCKSRFRPTENRINVEKKGQRRLVLNGDCFATGVSGLFCLCPNGVEVCLTERDKGSALGFLYGT